MKFSERIEAKLRARQPPTHRRSQPMSQEPKVRIAVGIPCYNEAAAVETVIADWRRSLPEAEIHIFDNNSTDGTGDLAAKLGIPVHRVPEQGKGWAVRAIFRELSSWDIVIMVDGDGTYPADAARALTVPILEGRADGTVGARRPVAEPDQKAMSPVRGLGNVLIRAAFRVLIGRGPGDLLSGYRAFSRKFRETVRLRSTGFEIETELASEAVARGLRVEEIPVSYYKRIAGTQSKLNAARDGARILIMILKQSLRLRPWRPLMLTLGLIGVGWLISRCF